ncbi:hypothetical protein Csa_014958 [Cucumis sativus]|uniref:Uncharacterized protein n=1 Tax=Cucumis sativus TaxID=3659 RepID=A0A0A0L0S8_CUCSA|nr:hypothetical protein Csa_014958 [Cucumis sativus]
MRGIDCSFASKKKLGLNSSRGEVRKMVTGNGRGGRLCGSEKDEEHGEVEGKGWATVWEEEKRAIKHEEGGGKGQQRGERRRRRFGETS